MIDPAILFPYVAACLLFAIVPGPSVTVVVANSLARGTKAGLLTILGTEIAMLTMVFIVAVGLDAVMGLVSEAFTIIKFAGAAYLVWIGFKMFTSSGKLEMGTPGEKLPLGRYLWQGALINWSNPQDAGVPRGVPAAVRRHEPAGFRPDHGARTDRHGRGDSLRLRLCGPCGAGAAAADGGTGADDEPGLRRHPDARRRLAGVPEAQLTVRRGCLNPCGGASHRRHA